MTAGMLKQVMAELTRVGCRIERLAHDPPLVTFSTPAGSRLALAADNHQFRLARVLDGPQRAYAQVARFATVREAVRAASAG